MTIKTNSPSHGQMGLSREMSVEWEQKVSSINGNNAIVESEIKDLIVETSSPAEGYLKGRIIGAIANAITGKKYSFKVSSTGEISEVNAPEVDWKKVFESIFTEYKASKSQQSFTVKMAELNFSVPSMMTIFSMPFIPFPSPTEVNVATWEKEVTTVITGIEIQSRVKFRIEEFLNTGENSPLIKISMESDSASGKTAIWIPSENVPLLMEIKIFKTKMDGMAIIASDGRIANLEKNYNMVIETQTGLPSLDKNYPVNRNVSSIMIPVEVSLKLEKIP